MRRCALLILLVGACAAPPLGLGAGPQLPSVGRGVVEGRTAMAAADGRQAFQAEVSGLFHIARWFAQEGGVVFTRVAQTEADGDVSVTGGFPYVRPRFVVGSMSLAIGLSGGAIGGGGGGVVGGIADAQLGYARGPWAAYLGGYRHGFELTSEAPIDVSSRQLRLGGQHQLRAGAVKVGIALEVFRQDDRLRNDERFSQGVRWGGAIRLSITSPEFK
ncbi:MAG: hypothetical protein KBG48_00885 [Kofleriaceae bacterium]|jgi:hypothetical protein|nr:hypothetical protein [Kofleriaceae bacterium]MBP9165899.1 hypothetical protein [Kofleriaceae bacterium]MBP9857558.1 hypothetical protein [Kofleriaceae bacterium]